MNLRRGLLRLWLVLSIAWIIAVGYDAYTTCVVSYLSDPPGTFRPSLARGPQRTLELLDRVFVIDDSHLAWAFGLPVAVLIIGAALWWAVAGFRK
jgi:hypothetical protein